ncbi:MAG: MATE family efflux transporter [Alistipes sp.]|nr:MATE family efflux transporter [Candidatus Minthomonas equi]
MNRRILKLAIPSILANISVPLVGMADIAVAGRLGNAAAIGAIAVGSMLFDLLYWGFSFLRVGTGGLTAQAYGRRDLRETITHLTRGIATSAASAVLIIAIQWIFVEFAFLFIDCTPEVESLSRQYFFIRVWAAPATLSLMAFKGWFIGMQNTVSPMIVDISVNVVNVAASIWLGLYTPMGFAGIALGTVIAQYSGLLLSIILLLVKYRDLFIHIDVRRDVRISEMKPYFKMNGDLFLRALCFMAIYCGYTTIAARFGDIQLAVSSIMMKLLMLYSYFTDGFAFAGEALVGRYIGANDHPSLTDSVKLIFKWCAGIVVLSTAVYAVGGEWLVRLMTNEQDVIQASRPFLIWLTLMPLFSCMAFVWDGIFIGATASTSIRNSMIWAVVAFYLVWFIFRSQTGIQTLYIAYFAHLIARDIFLSARARKDVFSKVS